MRYVPLLDVCAAACMGAQLRKPASKMPDDLLRSVSIYITHSD